LRARDLSQFKERFVEGRLVEGRLVEGRLVEDRFGDPSGILLLSSLGMS